jgi:hypothetical protein
MRGNDLYYNYDKKLGEIGMNQEFDKYYATYNGMLQIVRKKWLHGINYSFQSGRMTHYYRESLNEETVKRVYVMFCKHLFENKEYNQHAHLGESK